MADMSFDAVIVGGGNKGLVTAMYLTKFGGLSVGIFDERHELGGGWSSEEMAPGFIANTCSTYHCGFYHLPLYEDIPEFREYGARYVPSYVTQGVIFAEDDSCLLAYDRWCDPTQEKTAKEISRFSERDAETWLYLWEKCQRYWGPAVKEWRFSIATPPGVPDALDRLAQDPESGIDPRWLFQSPLQVFKDLFESPEAQILWQRGIQSLGYPMDLVGLGAASIMAIVWATTQRVYVIGGTHQLTHAAQRVILENGGKVFTNSLVEKILIEDGKAKGIKLSDGTEVEAKRVVVSTTDPYQLCFHLIGKEHLSPKILRRIENIETDWVTITWYTWALKEPPRYKAEKFNPDVNRCTWLAPTVKDVDRLVRESWERRLGKWPSEMNLIMNYHGGGGTMLGPEGKEFTILTEQFVLPAHRLSEKEWKERETQYADEVIGFWQQYAPNMTWDNVIDYVPVTPHFTSKYARNYGRSGNWAVIDNIPSQMGRFRPIPELSNHRTPIKDLYATGSAWPPLGFATSAQGYTCYKAIAEDLDLKRPWKEKGRAY